MLLISCCGNQCHQGGAIVKLGCEHPSYAMSTVISQDKLAALAEDFK